MADDADAGAGEGSAGRFDFLKQRDATAKVFIAAVENLPLEALLAQIRQYLQRSGEGVAFAGCEEIERLHTPFQQAWKQVPEDAFGSAGAHINQVKRGATEIGEIGSLHFESAVGENPGKELVRNSLHGRFVVQA